jgi:hypothetical protein
MMEKIIDFFKQPAPQGSGFVAIIIAAGMIFLYIYIFYTEKK